MDLATDGTTRATSKLRHSEVEGEQHGAAYGVHSALGLTVAESLLIGCQPVIVEGVSDHHYLTTIESLLISSVRIAPTRELVFPPAGGAKSTKIVNSILMARDNELPLATDFRHGVRSCKHHLQEADFRLFAIRFCY